MKKIKLYSQTQKFVALVLLFLFPLQSCKTNLDVLGMRKSGNNPEIKNSSSEEPIFSDIPDERFKSEIKNLTGSKGIFSDEKLIPKIKNFASNKNIFSNKSIFSNEEEFKGGIDKSEAILIMFHFVGLNS